MAFAATSCQAAPGGGFVDRCRSGSLGGGGLISGLSGLSDLLDLPVSACIWSYLFVAMPVSTRILYQLVAMLELGSICAYLLVVMPNFSRYLLVARGREISPLRIIFFPLA